MKPSTLQHAIQFLQGQPDMQKGEFFFLLASFVMYFKSPIRNEPWNTFSERIENGSLPFEKGILMTDEERNPHIFKNTKVSIKLKQDIRQILSEQLIRTKKTLESKYSFQNWSSTQSTDNLNNLNIIVVPDVIDPSRTPTLFPKSYLKKQIQKEKFINELTGHSFAWDLVDALKHDKPLKKKKMKKVSPQIFLDLIQKDLNKCSRTIQCCVVCRNKNIKFKSIKNYQSVSFCSLKCIEHWKY